MRPESAVGRRIEPIESTLRIQSGKLTNPPQVGELVRRVLDPRLRARTIEVIERQQLHRATRDLVSAKLSNARALRCLSLRERIIDPSPQGLGQRSSQ